MYNDPMMVAQLPNGAAPTPSFTTYEVPVVLRVRDLAPGKSVRVGIVDKNEETGYPETRFTFTIAQTPTKENAPLTTNRTLLRYDATRINEAGKPVTLSAQLIVSAPISAEFSSADALAQARNLAFVALFGTVKDASDTALDAASLQNDILKRALLGEP